MGVLDQSLDEAALPVFTPAFRRDLDILLRSRRNTERFEATPLPERFVAQILRASFATQQRVPCQFVRLGSVMARKATLANFEDRNALTLASSPGAPRTRDARLSRAALRDAPVQFAVFHDDDASITSGGGRGRDGAIEAVARMSLLAHALGIGFRRIPTLDPHAMARFLAVPSDWCFVACLCLGYSADEGHDPMADKAWRRERQYIPDGVLHR